MAKCQLSNYNYTCMAKCQLLCMLLYMACSGILQPHKVYNVTKVQNKVPVNCNARLL